MSGTETVRMVRIVWLCSGRTLQGFALATLLAISLAGCATRPAFTPNTAASVEQHWQGRMGVKVFSTPPQSFSARFELTGNAQQGRLSLFTPLGTTLARMHWSPGKAELVTTGEPQQFDSLAALSQATLGMEIPFANLFDWLQGNNTPAEGWTADLSALGDGKLNALRNASTPGADKESGTGAELKLILESD